MSDWQHILADLVEGLADCIDHGIQTTEDTVRYYFLLQLIRSGITPEQMILERLHPNPALDGKEIVFSVVQPDGVWDFEVKYHRPIPSGRNRLRTQPRGHITSNMRPLTMCNS